MSGRFPFQRWFVLSCFSLGFAAGCTTAAPRLRLRVDVELRASQDPTAVAGEAGEDAQGRSGPEGSLDGAREVFWMAPGFLRVDTHLAASGDRQRGGGEPVRRTFVDFTRGWIWESDSAGETVLRSLREVEYEARDRRREIRADYVDLYVRSPWVRDLESLGHFFGDGSLTLGSPDALGFYGARLAEEPGLVWELSLSGDESSDEFPGWAREKLFFRVLGVTPERARHLAAMLPGTPLGLRASVPAPEGSKVVLQYAVVGLKREVSEEEPFRVPRSREGLALAAAKGLSSARAVIAALRDPSRRPRGVTDLGLVLRLEELAAEVDLGEVAADVGATEDPALRKELLRLVLRRGGAPASATVEAELRSTSGPRALAAAEALVAEEHALAAAAVLSVLERRRQFTELPADLVAGWAVRRLRVVSRLSLDELARNLGPFWSSGEEFSDPGEALAREADFWLRWGEGRSTLEVPRSR
jgi:hypothetical protein